MKSIKLKQCLTQITFIENVVVVLIPSVAMNFFCNMFSCAKEMTCVCTHMHIKPFIYFIN